MTEPDTTGAKGSRHVRLHVHALNRDGVAVSSAELIVPRSTVQLEVIWPDGQVSTVRHPTAR